MDDKEEDQLKYAKKVYQIINNLDSKCHLGSVCVLVRKRSEGVNLLLAQHALYVEPKIQ